MSDPRSRQQYEALTPVQIEALLTRSISDLTGAQRSLQEARDRETDAELAYKRAYFRAVLDRNAPSVQRGGYTVAERDAWVGLRVAEEYETYKRAEAVREAAQDKLRTVRDVTEVLRSLGASVRTAYEVSGSGR